MPLPLRSITNRIVLSDSDRVSCVHSGHEAPCGETPADSMGGGGGGKAEEEALMTGRRGQQLEITHNEWRKSHYCTMHVKTSRVCAAAG